MQGSLLVWDWYWPQSIIRRQEVSLVEDKSDMVSSHFHDSDFEGDRESADLSAKEEMPKELVISSLTSLVSFRP